MLKEESGYKLTIKITLFVYYLFVTTRCPQRATGVQPPNLNLFKKLKQPNIQKGHILNLCGLISYALNTMQATLVHH